MKCSNCHEVWTQLPAAEEFSDAVAKAYEKIPEGVKPLPDGSNLPTVSPDEEGNGYGRARAMGYAVAVIICAAVFGALLLGRPIISEAMPFTKNFYAMLGGSQPVVAGANLSFAGLEVKAEPDAAGEKIIISGKIVNAVESPETVPLIEAQMKNEAGEVLERWMIKPPQSVLAAYGELPFSTNYVTATPGAAANIHLRFVAH